MSRMFGIAALLMAIASGCQPGPGMTPNPRPCAVPTYVPKTRGPAFGFFPEGVSVDLVPPTLCPGEWIGVVDIEVTGPDNRRVPHQQQLVASSTAESTPAAPDTRISFTPPRPGTYRVAANFGTLGVRAEFVVQAVTRNDSQPAFEVPHSCNPPSRRSDGGVVCPAQLPLPKRDWAQAYDSASDAVWAWNDREVRRYSAESDGGFQLANRWDGGAETVAASSAEPVVASREGLSLLRLLDDGGTERTAFAAHPGSNHEISRTGNRVRLFRHHTEVEQLVMDVCAFEVTDGGLALDECRLAFTEVVEFDRAGQWESNALQGGTTLSFVPMTRGDPVAIAVAPPGMRLAVLAGRPYLSSQLDKSFVLVAYYRDSDIAFEWYPRADGESFSAFEYVCLGSESSTRCFDLPGVDSK